MPRARRRPNDLKTYDRRTTDLLRNAMVSPIEVDDPMEAGATLIVMRSTRNDPLASLHARKFIDEAQYQGGRAFQHDFETAERGPRAIDPSKEAVEGGLAPEPITESQRKAAHALKRVYRALGPDGSALVHDLLVHGLNRAQIADARRLSGKRWEEYFGMRLHECLHRLSYIYGFATEPKGKKRVNFRCG